MAGLPGTGLGGIFYVLLVIWMVLRESWFAARGSSTSGRWTRIARLGSLSGTIVVSLWVEGIMLQALIAEAPVVAAPAKAAPAAFALNALTPALAIAPFAILAVLLVSLQLAKLVLPPTHRAETR
jgi:hypothetical protein